MPRVIPGFRALLATALAVVCAGAWPSAQVFDPTLRFRVLNTEHFVIHFHQGEDPLAQRLAGIAEDTWHALERPLGLTPPRRTQVVLADQTELCNGYATPGPYDTVAGLQMDIPTSMRTPKHQIL